MDNKEIFNMAGLLMSEMSTKGILSKEQSAKFIKDSIYDALKATLTTQPATNPDQEKEEVFELAKALTDDPNYARAWLTQRLAKSVESGNAQAAKEIRDILQIASTTSDLAIETIDYTSLCDDCPKLHAQEPI